MNDLAILAIMQLKLSRRFQAPRLEVERGRRYSRQTPQRPKLQQWAASCPAAASRLLESRERKNRSLKTRELSCAYTERSDGRYDAHRSSGSAGWRGCGVARARQRRSVSKDSVGE